MSTAAWASARSIATTTPFFKAHGDDDALAGGQAVGLDDNRCALLVDVGMCCGRLGKSLEPSGRNVVARHEALGEILGGFELGSFLRRAKDLQATGTENVHHAGRQRRLGPDDRGMDLLALGIIGQRLDVGKRQVFQLVLARRAGIAGRNEHLLHALGLGQTPGHGVLAAAGTDYQ